MSAFEIVGLTKSGGPLTKKISLSETGALISDGSACIMVAGEAKRFTFNNLTIFADVIGRLGSDRAIALGALHHELPKQVNVLTKRRIIQLNGEAPTDVVVICRTHENISYRPGKPALVLVDFDAKGMPDYVRRNIDRAGGPVLALQQVLPELADCGHVIRASTSAGLSRNDTGQVIQGSSGVHIYISAEDGSDAERFLRTLHDRCWLAGFGWKMVGAAGQLLDRSIVDRMVYAAERLVFEGAPVLEEPLRQSAEARQPKVHDGPLLDTLAACPPLTLVEQAELSRLQAVEAQRLAADAGAARRKFIDTRSKDLADRAHISVERARIVIEKQVGGVLLPDLMLPFDDPELAGITVRDVLADPDRYVGETMADPIEGVAYGTGKAKIMRRADGSLWIHSYAHGRIVYDLKLDAASVRAAIQQAAPEDVVSLFVRLAPDAELNAAEIEQLRDEVSDKTGTGKRRLDQTLGEARKQREREQREQERLRRQAERLDRRPEIKAPKADAERLPVVTSLDEVLLAIMRNEPPIRDADGRPTDARCRSPFLLHELLTQTGECEHGA
jgi:hypothetical protein